MVRNFSFVVIALIVVFSACSNKSNYSRKPVTNILITPANKIITPGNDFTIALQTKVKDGKIKNIELFIDNQLLTTTQKSDFTFTVSSKPYLPGNHTIKAVATKTDGVSGSYSSIIFIPSDITPKKLGFNIVKTLPHNTTYFTEGFEFVDGVIYEGTGNQGSSYIYAYKPGDKKVIRSIKNEDQYFGEGITVLNNKIYQLTYKHRKGFIYDFSTFKKIGEFPFTSNEGWGLTNDGKHLIMSDGTSKIHFIDPSTFSIVKTIEVCDNNGIIENINELEYVDGVIYSNIWMRNTILKIDAQTGKIMASINLESLLSKFNSSSVDVLNGIAYNKSEKLFYVTGKYWPNMFAITFNP
jgi:glutaminyl-peptide cyclotransferase